MAVEKCSDAELTIGVCKILTRDLSGARICIPFFHNEGEWLLTYCWEKKYSTASTGLALKMSSESPLTFVEYPSRT